MFVTVVAVAVVGVVGVVGVGVEVAVKQAVILSVVLLYRLYYARLWLWLWSWSWLRLRLRLSLQAFLLQR